MMSLFLLDRDGVVIVNRATNVKTAGDLELLPGVPEAIARLNGAGFDVAICTNQPEVARGVLSKEQLDAVHESLQQMLAARGARVDMILSCCYDHKRPRRKPSGGMLGEALSRYRAIPAETPFVGDQADDLKAAFHVGCRRVLVRTGLGRKTLEQGLPPYLSPVAVHDDLAAALPVTTSRLRRPAAHMIGPTLEAQAAAPYRPTRPPTRGRPLEASQSSQRRRFRPTILRPTQVLPRSLHVKEVTFKSV